MASQLDNTHFKQEAKSKQFKLEEKTALQTDGQTEKSAIKP